MVGGKWSNKRIVNGFSECAAIKCYHHEQTRKKFKNTSGFSSMQKIYQQYIRTTVQLEQSPGPVVPTGILLKY